MFKFRSTVLAGLVVVAGSVALGANEKPLLLQSPTLSKTHIAFAYAGDIWIVSREGGDARRLTYGIGDKYRPIFSPNGETIAFTGEYDGNADVYVVPAAGGEPKRLTYHPAPDVAIAWAPDGKRILFLSLRSSPSDPPKFFTLPAGGGFPTEVPLPMADEGCFSPDGSKLAYVPNFQWQAAWKRYWGGQTQHIWIVDLADSSVVDRVPRQNSNDFNPMWVGSRLYFLSDRSGPVSLFAYDTSTRKVSEVAHNHSLDFKSASAGPGGIVYEQFGSLHLLDLESGKTREINVRVTGELPEIRPHFEKLEAMRILNANISPTGQRALFEVHGEVLTVPAEKGDIRNLTNTPAVADRDPSWSPDGKSIAYFSDESGEYALHVRDQNGLGAVKKIDLGNPPSFFYSPTWSPDSKKIAYTDKRLNVWYVDLDKGAPVCVDTDLFDNPFHNLNPVWSPDSKWIAYTKQLPSRLHAVFVYPLDTAKSMQVTDGMSDALYADWDKGGKYLYFTASTDTGLTASWIDMSSINRPVTRSVYVAVLKRDLPSPLAPESDEEKPEETKKGASSSATQDQGRPAEKEDKNKESSKEKEKPKEPVKVAIDIEKIGQRILALPVPARNYQGLSTGKEGEVFLLEGPPVPPDDGPSSLTLQKFTLKIRKTDKLLEGITAFALSANGEKMLYKQGDQWFIAKAEKPAEGPPKPGEGGPLKLADMEVYVDARCRVEADVPRGVEDRARLSLRPRTSRPRPEGGRELLRSLSRERLESRRPQLPFHRDAGQSYPGPCLRAWRRPSRAQQG
jgi:tricorn protease